MAPLEIGKHEEKRHTISMGALLPNGVTIPMEAIKKHTMKKKSMIDPDHRERLNYRIDADHYELLSRLAYDTRHNSIQRIIDDRLFPRTWRVELEELRAKHRKLGLKDTLFYQTNVLRKLGIKPWQGRPKKYRLKMAA